MSVTHSKSLLNMVFVALSLFVVGGAALVMTNNLPTAFKSGASNVNETRNGMLLKRGGEGFSECVVSVSGNSLSQLFGDKIGKGKDNVNGGKEPGTPTTNTGKTQPESGTPSKGVSATGITSKVQGGDVVEVKKEQSKKKNKERDDKAPAATPTPTPNPVVTFDYGILDGSHCTPLVANASAADPLVGKKVTVKGTEQAGIFYASSIELFQEATPQPSSSSTNATNTNNTNHGNNNGNKTSTPEPPGRQVNNQGVVHSTPLATPKTVVNTPVPHATPVTRKPAGTPESASTQNGPTVGQIVNTIINNVWKFLFPPTPPKPKEILGSPNTI